MPQRDVRRSGSRLTGLRRNPDSAPTWADEISGKHKVLVPLVRLQAVDLVLSAVLGILSAWIV
jgi:hypothetical protein